MASNKVTKQPNIVFILADDLGWSDLGFQQNLINPNLFSEKMITPVIDTLASEGVIFENHYVHPMCSPTRAAFMTGKYASNVGLQHHVILGNQASGLPLAEITLPELLRSRGYSTHIIGKWHLGFHTWDYHPNSRGFDSFLGYNLGANDYWNHSSAGWLDEERRQVKHNYGYDFWLNKVNVAEQLEGIHSMDLYAKEAERIIGSRFSQEAHAGPMFLYLAVQAPHSPLTPRPEDLSACLSPSARRRNYAALVLNLDKLVGRVVKSLKKNNMWDNTLIVFSADNGGEAGGGGYNWPLRGQKTTLWEGGTRAVSFIHPGGTNLLRKTGHRHRGLLHISDWLPTLFRLAGGRPEKLPPRLDGVDAWDSISAGAPSPRDTVLYNADAASGCGAVRQGRWKLVRRGGCGRPALGGWFPPPEVDAVARGAPLPLGPLAGPEDDEDPWLVDLEEDPFESTNLYARRPEVARGLEALLQRYVLAAARNQNAEEPGDPRADPARHGGRWMPWN
ncbi:unnamed protein product, partial [Heterosigma akashiwo]